MRHLEPFVEAASKYVSGFREDHVPLYPLIEAVFRSHAAGDHKRAVKAQCKVALEQYAAVLHLVSADMGLPAHGLCRNLFEGVLSALYLARDENRYDDFLRFGTKIHYELVRNVDPRVAALHSWVPEELAVRKIDYDSLSAHFGKSNNWSKKSVADLTPIVGYEQLYKTFYKEASSIAHGNSFVLLKRNHFHSWEIEANEESWQKYTELAGRFSYLTIAYLFTDVDETLGFGHTEECQRLKDHIARHHEYALPPGF